MPEDLAAVMRQLHDEHAGALWGFCLRLTSGNRAQAEDVAQETLLRAWRNAAVLCLSLFLLTVLLAWG